MRVLVVDDEPQVRAAVSEFLEFSGMEVLEATNGLEALLKVKRERPDAIVLDLRMPRLGGIEALKRIRRLNPNILVAVVTGDIDEQIHGQALGLGARAVLTKPVMLRTWSRCSRRTRGAGADPRGRRRKARPARGRRPAAPAARALVVDDDDDVRQMLADFLASTRIRSGRRSPTRRPPSDARRSSLRRDAPRHQHAGSHGRGGAADDPGGRAPRGGARW